MLAAAKENPENEEVLSLAIDVVAASHDDSLTNQVIELLLGEVDGEARVRKKEKSFSYTVVKIEIITQLMNLFLISRIQSSFFDCIWQKENTWKQPKQLSSSRKKNK